MIVEPLANESKDKTEESIRRELSLSSIIQDAKEDNQSTSDVSINSSQKQEVSKVQRQYFSRKISIREQTKFAAEYKSLLKKIAEADFSFVYAHKLKIISLTERILERYSAINQHEDLLEAMLILFHSKVQNISCSRAILPDLYSLKNRVAAKIGCPRSNRKFTSTRDTQCFKVYPKQCLTDQIFKHFVQSLQTSKSRSGQYYLRDQNDVRIALKDYVAKVPQFLNIYWQEIFQIAEQVVYQYDGGKVNYALKQEYMNNILLEQLPHLECLGCTKFLYQGHNIFTPGKGCKMALMGSIHTLQLTSNTLIEEIVGLLNNKGGVILYGCERENLNVVVKGDSILEKDIQKIKEQIQKYLKDITPLPQAEICISIVPVKQNPYTNKGVIQTDQNGKKIVVRKFIEGQYVVRVKVTPIKNSTTYFYLRDGKPTFTVSKESLNYHPNSKQHYSGKYFAAFIKKRFAKYAYQEQNISSQYLFKDVDHKCEEPYKGLPLIDHPTVKSSENPEESYKYASILVAKPTYHKIILDRFKKYGISGEIVVRFQNYKLKGVAGVAIFYHDMRCEQIQGIIGGSKEFQFQGRQIMVIAITPYVKLNDRNQRCIMPRSDFNSLEVWLRRQFKENKLKMYKFITDDNDTQFYLDSGSKAANMFMYLVMTTFSQRSQFRSPKGIERMQEMEKNSRLKKYYESQ